MAFSRRLGELDNIRRYLQGGRKPRYAHYELFDASNLDGDGGLLDPDSPRGHSNRGNGLFHVDSSFNPRRASFSLLRAVELPPPGTGGNTDFADSRAAWDALPPELRDELLRDDYVAAHCMAQSRKLGSPEYFRGLDPAAAPMSWHRVAQRHEPSGRMGLYVGAHAHHVEGLGADESAALIAALNAHAAQERFRTSVEWRRPGDLVIWDNRCVMHRAAGGSFEGRHRRDMRRTTVHDDSPTAWGLNAPGTEMPGYNTWQKPEPVVAAAVKV